MWSSITVWAHECAQCHHQWETDTSSPPLCPKCGNQWPNFSSSLVKKTVPKRIGFTGPSDHPMTDPQLTQLHMLLGDLQQSGAKEATHGMAEGCDEQFHGQAKGFKYFVIGVPGVTVFGKVWKRSQKCGDADLVLPPRAFLVRNRDIVRESDVMIATPAQKVAQPRSGTWHTIRMAREAKRPLVLLWPDGTSTVEHLPGITTADEFRQSIAKELR